jgi:RNA polymerase sigma-70 factor (ECF subfamily)
MLYRFGLYLSADAELSRELAQETVRVALTKDWPEELAADSSEDAVGRWLRGVLHNLLRNERRRARRSRVLFDTEVVAAAEARFAGSFAARADRWQSSRLALAQCLERLQPDPRELVRGRYERGESVNDMARRLALAANVLSKRLERIRAALRECIERRVREDAHD